MNDKDYIDILSKYINYKSLEKDKKTKEKFERELEIRFSIDYSIQDILKKINNQQKFQIEYEKSIVYYYNNDMRKISFLSPVENEIQQYKKDISSDIIILQGYTIKIAYSHETEEQIKKDEKIVEIKERDRYIIKNFLGDQDLHLTTSYYKFRNEQLNTIEIEYKIDKLKNINQFIDPVKYIFDLMYVKSIELLSPPQMKYIISIFNDYLLRLKQYKSKKDDHDIYKNKLIDYEDKPVSLPSDKVNIIKTDKYFVTNKLNGTRYFLFIIGGDFFLIGKTGSKISKIPTHVWKLFHSEKINRNHVFILDGEYFDGLDNNKLYYAFDILLHIDIYLNSTPYYDRLNLLHKISDYLVNISPVQMKYILPGNRVHNVIKYMKDIFKKEWDFDNDGLIFTPFDSIYANKKFKTYKWKFLHHQSVDVFVKRMPTIKDYYECYIGDDESPNNIKLFSDRPLFTNEKLRDGNIVEVSFDKNLNEFYMLRLRPDKEKPNYKTVGESFWNDINNEIPLSILSKEELFINNKDDWKNFRKSSNIEKDNLIKTITPGSGFLVIDIGFGKGGDLLKYARQGIENIIGIEPDVQNIKDFCDRYSLLKTDEVVTIYNNIKVEDKLNKKYHNISVTIINKSGSDYENIDIVQKIIKEVPKRIIVSAFFSLTYFFNPLDDFTKLFYIISQFNPERIIGTVMDGEQTKNFLNNYSWNEKTCGLELISIKNKELPNKIFIKIEDSETVIGHYEYLFNFYKLKEYLSWYNYKLNNRKFFNFNIGRQNLLTYFASLYCSFDFISLNPENTMKIKNIYVKRRYNEYYKTIKIILDYNLRLGLSLDCQYLYNSFILPYIINENTGKELIKTNELLEKFFKNKSIHKYSILRNIITNDINGSEEETYRFLNKNVDKNILDSIRYFLLTNKIDKNFKLLYEVVFDDIVKEKIFYENPNLSYKISNYFYDYYRFNNDDSIEFFNLLKNKLSPIENYNLYEYNSGIANYTIIFGKLFKNVYVYESDLLHFQISKTNVSLYNNIKTVTNNCLNSNINNKILNITFNNNILLEHIKNEKNNVLFINYQFKKEPSIDEIKTFFDGSIIILTPEINFYIQDEYYYKYFRYKLQNNYIYFINF